MPKTTFENVGRRRLTPKGSRAPNELELDLPDLKPGEGQLLPSGEIALNDPEAGVIVLRADNAYAYIPKVESSNPLDKLVSGSSEEDDDSSENKPAETASATPAKEEKVEADQEHERPAIESGDSKPLIGDDGKSVHTTLGGQGYGPSSF